MTSDIKFKNFQTDMKQYNTIGRQQILVKISGEVETTQEGNQVYIITRFPPPSTKEIPQQTTLIEKDKDLRNFMTDVLLDPDSPPGTYTITARIKTEPDPKTGKDEVQAETSFEVLKS